MDPIHYLNTDLDLSAARDLLPLCRFLEDRGHLLLSLHQTEPGKWTAILESNSSFAEPDSNIASILAVIEQLTPEMQELWDACTQREFNVGYDFGNGPFPFTTGITAATLARIAAAGASLRYTFYPGKFSE